MHIKRFRITVEYDLYAISEYDAVAQVFNNRIEPETVDVTDLPVDQTQEIVIPNF